MSYCSLANRGTRSPAHLLNHSGLINTGIHYIQYVYAGYLSIGTLGAIPEDSDVQLKATAVTTEGRDMHSAVPVERTITVAFAEEETAD